MEDRYLTFKVWPEPCSASQKPELTDGRLVDDGRPRDDSSSTV